MWYYIKVNSPKNVFVYYLVFTTCAKLELKHLVVVLLPEIIIHDSYGIQAIPQVCYYLPILRSATTPNCFTHKKKSLQNTFSAIKTFLLIRLCM